MNVNNNEYKQGGTLTLIKIAFRNIWRNKRRTAFCFSAVGIAVFFIIMYTAMIGGMTGSMDEIVQIYELGHVQVVSADYEAEMEYMPVQYPVEDGRSWREMAGEIMEIPGVRAVLPRITTLASLLDSRIKHGILWGIDIEAETAANHLNMTNRSNGIVEGRFPERNSNEVAIGSVFAEKSGLGVGDELVIRTATAHFSERFWQPVISGIFHFDFIRFDENYIIADIERLQRLMVLDEGTQQLVIFLDDDSQSASVAASVMSMMSSDSVVSQWLDNYWVAMMRMVVPLFVIVFLIFLIVASFLIVNTVVMIIHERIKEIGMMGCLGMTRGEIVKVFFFESLFLAAFGALLGVIAGGLPVGLLADFPIRMGDLYGNTFSDMPLGNTIFFEFSWGNLFMAWGLGVLVASIFTLIPSLKSAFVEPVEALRR